MKSFNKNTIIWITCLLFSITVHGQLYIPSGAVFHIDNTAIVSVNGDVQNLGTYENFGQTSVSGNWTNNGMFDTLGTFILNGSDQTVDHNAAFENFVIDGFGNKTIVSDISIHSSLTLNSGILIPSTENIIISLDSVATTTTGNDDSYINGYFYNHGSGTRYFPIGNNDGFFPSEMFRISGSSPFVGMRVVENTTETLFSTIKRVATIVQSRYWQSKVISGNLNNAQVALSYYPYDNVYDSLIINVLQSDSIAGDYRIIGKDSSIISRIPVNYVASIDTTLQEFYALAAIRQVDWSIYYFPNALSHNAPGADDRAAKIYGGDVIFEKEGFSIRISNNWGNIIFESESLEEMTTKGWTGINKKTGRTETTGQYNYIMKAKVKDGSTYNDAGSIWIID